MVEKGSAFSNWRNWFPQKTWNPECRRIESRENLC